MAAISDPRAISFCNEQVRPLCESIRALSARVAAASTSWFLGTNALFPNDTSIVADGRTSEGISILTGADVNSAVSELIAAMATLNAQIIEKPCVRVLSVS